MKRRARWSMLLAMALLLTGCYYAPPPVAVAVPGPTVGQRFDRSWSAAAGAMVDQGVTIIAQDRGAGVIRGTRGPITVLAAVQTQADGSIQIKFDTNGATDTDPGLIHRVSESYERRMGR